VPGQRIRDLPGLALFLFSLNHEEHEGHEEERIEVKKSRRAEEKKKIKK
jgi:hypothetical protein